MKNNKIKTRMIELGINQKNLASILGISIQSLNDKLNGRGIISIIEASKITDLLNFEDPSDIFFASQIPNMQQNK